MTKQSLTLYLAAPRGFCAGVDRAIKIVEMALDKQPLFFTGRFQFFLQLPDIIIVLLQESLKPGIVHQ